MRWLVVQQQDGMRGPRRGMGMADAVNPVMDAESVEVTEGGALRLLDADGGLVAAFGPTGWLSCTPYVESVENPGGLIDVRRGGRPGGPPGPVV